MHDWFIAPCPDISDWDYLSQNQLMCQHGIRFVWAHSPVAISLRPWGLGKHLATTFFLSPQFCQQQICLQRKCGHILLIHYTSVLQEDGARHDVCDLNIDTTIWSWQWQEADCAYLCQISGFRHRKLVSASEPGYQGLRIRQLSRENN